MGLYVPLLGLTHHLAQEYVDAYLEAAKLIEDRKGPLFRSCPVGRQDRLEDRVMSRETALRMIKRRARQAGLPTEICAHSFRGTGITEYLRNGGDLEVAARIAGHESTRTTQLYNRVQEEISLDEIEWRGNVRGMSLDKGMRRVAKYSLDEIFGGRKMWEIDTTVLRKALNDGRLSIEELAKISRVSPRTISRALKSQVRRSQSATIRRLALALEISPAALTRVDVSMIPQQERARPAVQRMAEREPTDEELTRPKRARPAVHTGMSEDVRWALAMRVLSRGSFTKWMVY